MKILVVEDEKFLNETISDFLKKSGEIVISVFSKLEAEDKLVSHQFDVVILDITLPDGTGIDLIPIIKQNQLASGILILSAKDSIEDKIKGLDLGADDYITKPFHMAELNSRVKALIRRTAFKGDDIISFEEIKINVSESQVYVYDQLLSLTKKEYMLLLYFINNKNRVITKESIAEHLWGDHVEYMDSYDFIYTHIKNLRKKIMALNGVDYLSTIHGIGYKYGLS